MTSYFLTTQAHPPKKKNWKNAYKKKYIFGFSKIRAQNPLYHQNSGHCPKQHNFRCPQSSTLYQKSKKKFWKKILNDRKKWFLGFSFKRLGDQGA